MREAARAWRIVLEPHGLVVGAAMATVFATLALIARYVFPLPPQTIFAGACLASFLVALSVIDVLRQRLPDVLTLPLLGLGLGLAAMSGHHALAWHAAAAGAGYLALRCIGWLFLQARGVPGLGGGDAKLLAAGGAWVGLEALPAAVLVAAVTALATVAVARGLGRPVDRQCRIPFGPFLAVGIWCAWLFGPLLPS